VPQCPIAGDAIARHIKLVQHLVYSVKSAILKMRRGLGVNDKNDINIMHLVSSSIIEE